MEPDTMTTPTRLTPADRKAAILTAAVSLATDTGYDNITLTAVARVAGVSYALIVYYFNSADCLLAAVMEEAVRLRVLSVVAEGLAHRHPVALEAPQALRQEAAASLAGAGGEV
jgi:AcrR family transcriptional regulator